MPNNNQGRTDNMPTTKHVPNKGLTSFIILVLFIGVVALVTFG